MADGSSGGVGGKRGLEAAEMAVRKAITTGVKRRGRPKHDAGSKGMMKPWLDLLGLSERLKDLRVVHVAGTKGKGSTCAFTEAILRAHGLKTGLFTSPHLVDVRERFRLNGRMCPEDVFLDNFWRVWDKLGGGDPFAVSEGCGSDFPGFFQLLTLVALELFSNESVDVAVIEVGIGGRKDATNVVHSWVTGVSRLDFDHCDILGYRLSEIAFEKAGIFKPGASAFSIEQRPDALARLQAVAEEVGVYGGALQVVRVTGDEKLGMAGSFQKENAALALELAKSFLARAEKKFDADAARSALRDAHWPGRAHRYVVDDTTLFLDGAHTQSSTLAAATWFQEAIGMMETKGCGGESGDSGGDGGELVLLYNNGPDRHPWPLLLPLLVAAPWDRILICPNDESKPTHGPPIRRDNAVSMFMEEREKQEDTWWTGEGKLTEEEQEALAASLRTAKPDTSPCASESDSIAFQEVIGACALVAATHPAFERSRRRLAYLLPTTHPTPSSPPPVIIYPSIRKALDTALHPKTSVLVTGSLYLVGGVLKAAQWRAKESHEE